MKKLIFLLLLAQTISFLYGDSACMGYSKYMGHEGEDQSFGNHHEQKAASPSDWRWGIKSPQPIKCYCNCEKYAQAHGRCIECWHHRVPKALEFKSTDATKSQTTQAIIIKHATKKTKETRKDKKAQKKAELAKKHKEKSITE